MINGSNGRLIFIACLISALMLTIATAVLGVLRVPVPGEVDTALKFLWAFIAGTFSVDIKPRTPGV